MSSGLKEKKTEPVKILQTTTRETSDSYLFCGLISGVAVEASFFIGRGAI